jgi:hypothetical protein
MVGRSVGAGAAPGVVAGGGTGDGEGGRGTVVQAASKPRIAALARRPTPDTVHRKLPMALILLEALAALAVLLLIVWWTMFSGRNKGERPVRTRAVGGTEGGAKARIGGSERSHAAERSAETPSTAYSSSGSRSSRHDDHTGSSSDGGSDAGSDGGGGGDGGGSSD